MALRDLSELRMPGEYLASSIEESHLAPAVASFLDSAAPASDPSQALAVIEMHAAGIFTPDPDPVRVSVQYQELLKAWPDSPLVHQRYGAYLLTRLQQMALKEPNHKFAPAPSANGAFSEAEDIAEEAQRELEKAVEIDPHNSLAYYDLAWSHMIFGDTVKAAQWLYKGLDRAEFDSGDDVVLGGAARVLTGAGVPQLEAYLAAYKLAEFQPSYLAGRVEALTSVLITDKATTELKLRGSAYGNHLAAIEDLSDKLLQTAFVLRQTQSSFVTSGILWRKVLAETPESNPALREAARKRLAETSYRYVLVGWERAGLGLLPQQSVVELDTPLDLRLPFSSGIHFVSSFLFVAMVVFLLPTVVVGAVSLKFKPARPLAQALCVLFVFTGLAYSASFYSTVNERSRVARSLDSRLRVICQSPDYVRDNGQPEKLSDFRTDIPKKMLFTFDYTMQAARVLAYVGTRDCYDALINSLTDPHMQQPTEVINALEEETGTSFGPGGQLSANSSKADTEKAISSWRKWWQDNRKSFPETAVEAAERQPRHGA